MPADDHGPALLFSAVLDELLLARYRQRRRQAVEHAVARYYSSMSEGERAEELRWSQFALPQLPDKAV